MRSAPRAPIVLPVMMLLSFAGSERSSTASETTADTNSRSPLAVDDYFGLQDVEDPRVSPDGEWIAYKVTTRDLKKDKSKSRIWMVPTAGTTALPMTEEESSASRPRWSPDGRYLAFLSARNEGKTQVWTLFRQGGDAVQLTNTAQAVSSFEWSPDATRMVLVLQDPTPRELEEKKQGKKLDDETLPPWVVDRQQFKRDYTGYLDRRRTHLYVLDVESKKLVQVTSGDFDDTQPVWSPDGHLIAFVSNRSTDPDANYNTDIWVVAADNPDRGETLLQVTDNPGPDQSPAWSPDGHLIAYVSATDTDAIVYATRHLAVVSSSGGEAKLVSEQLDRMVFSPAFSNDGRSVYFLLEDSGEQAVARIPATGGKVERVVGGPRSVSAFHLAKDGSIAALVSEPQLPPEVFHFKDQKLVRVTHTNDTLLSGILLGEVENIVFPSRDGTQIEGFVVKPPGFVKGFRYPTLLRIHGGPVSQYDFGFNFQAQLFAANGYVVVLPNPRGSSGYGQDFSIAIWQQWGSPDYEDVMAAVDYLIDQGYADPARLGVGGWSYGGMLTNHVITKTDRFKAAVTGASATLYAANYGHDQYQRWWEYELGLPWENRELWEELSPFYRVEKVVTPTLIVGGEKDWNVPIINSEQLYLALKRLGKTTELVVYPGEFHGIATPSYIKDLYERYLHWYGKFVKGVEPKAAAETSE